MQKDWMKSTATYTFTEKDHKNGVKHNFSYVAKDASAEVIAKFGDIISSLAEGELKGVTVATTDQVKVTNAAEDQKPAGEPAPAPVPQA
ncbi:hypothetical protein ACFQ22_10380 [Lentilactobacillus raoultii]|uniref:DUF1659 domain-containing protein n=1 Tax=Lentilactobacillus raoultii TaxID=1987503 RepID=A0ABW3PLD8_9LACO|nr:hypothetical protein [Lentilactobacillus raoultii]